MHVDPATNRQRPAMQDGEIDIINLSTCTICSYVVPLLFASEELSCVPHNLVVALITTAMLDTPYPLCRKKGGAKSRHNDGFDNISAASRTYRRILQAQSTSRLKARLYQNKHRDSGEAEESGYSGDGLESSSGLGSSTTYLDSSSVTTESAR